MEAENKNQIKSAEPEFALQWGKRLRCVRVKNPNFSSKSAGGIRRKITSRIVTDNNDPSFSPLNRSRSSEGFGNGKSPEKEERYYTTRGSSMGEERENGKLNIVEGNGYGVSVQEKGNIVWPKLFISLSSKEKEEDFLAMKGCKLPQRPKKRAKLIQRSLLLVSPGAWLPDMCQERYEVREKKTPKKRPRGLKAMGAVVDSDSE
ncbi:putative membrane protein ycf78 [Bienertia sinuspersici]